ncbi:MAG TPA: ceramidase domain-containing protein, partial [Anaerolineales bacterium]|nr:ceramidase domain-containing protein [Anaerolineales bacterium]
MNKISDFVVPILTAILISGLTIAVLLLLNPNIWNNWEPATCIKTGCFCESAKGQSPIRQAANTYSSLTYVFSGMLIFAYASKGKRLPAGYSYLMGISIIIIGVGSAFYHASLTFIGQFFDVFGMFLLAAFMLVYAWERIWKLRLTTTLWLYLSLNVFLSWLQFAIPDTRRYVFAIVLIVALIFEYYFRVHGKPQIEARFLWIGVGLLTVAYIIWILDNTRIVCFENSLLQGHAIWHTLGAISV